MMTARQLLPDSAWARGPTECPRRRILGLAANRSLAVSAGEPTPYHPQFMWSGVVPLPLVGAERALPLLLTATTLRLSVYRSGVSGPSARPLYQIPIEPCRLLELLAVATRRR